MTDPWCWYINANIDWGYIDGIHGTPYIAAPLGSVMGNLQKETLIFPSRPGKIPSSWWNTRILPWKIHPFSPMDWHRLTPRIHGIYADGWRKGRLCRQDRRCGWAPPKGGLRSFLNRLGIDQVNPPNKKATLRESGKIAKICKDIPSGYLT